MASYRPRGDKYEVYWRDLAGKQRSRKANSAAIANALVRRIEDSLALGVDWKPEVVVEQPDLEKVIAKYLDAMLHQIRKGTRRRYTENLDLFKRFLRDQQPRGTLDSALLTRPNLVSFYSWLHKPENSLHGHGRESDTSRKIVEVVQLAWEWAYASENWSEGVIPLPKRIEMKRSEQPEVRAPTWAEMDACVVACNGWHKKLATFLRYTGMRPGETLLLLWSDLNLKTGKLTVRKEIQKAGPTRTICLSPHLLEELATWDRVTEPYIIPSARRESERAERERQAQPGTMIKAWKRSGVDKDAWEAQPHKSFRTGFKSGMKRLGADMDTVDYFQGHKLRGGAASSRYYAPGDLPQTETAALIPKISSTTTNVTRLPQPSAA